MSSDDFMWKMYETLTEEVAARPNGQLFSMSNFQRRHRIGFVMVGRVFDRAVTDGLLTARDHGKYRHYETNGGTP